jgi:uncharacterized protein involved in outer membrane biogenesis
VNAPGRSSPDFLTIERIDLGIEFWPLFERVVVIDSVKIEGADLHLESDRDCRLESPLELDSFVSDDGEGSVRIELREVEARKIQVFYHDNRDDVSHSLALHEVRLDSQDLESEISIRIEAEFEGSKIAITGRIGSLAELLKPSQPFPVDLEGQFFEAKVEAKGSVREPWSLTGVDLELTGDIPDLVVRRHALSQVGALHFSARISDLDGSLGIEQFHLANEKTEPVRISAEGKLDDLGTLQDVAVDLEVDTDSLDVLIPLIDSSVDLRWPASTRLSTRLKLSDRAGHLDLDGTAQAVIVGGTFHMDAKGGIHDLTNTPTIDVLVTAKADDLAPITALFPDFPHHGAFGPLAATGRLKGDEHRIAISDLDVLAGDRQQAWIDLKGSVADIAELRDVDLALTFGAQSLHHLKSLLEFDLPHTSKIEGSAAINDRDGSLGLEKLALHGGTNSPVEIHLDARIDDFAKRDEIEVELELRGRDSQVLGALAGLDLPKIAPVEFHGHVIGSDEHLTVDGLTLRLGETRLGGDLSGSFPPNVRPSVQARLSSKSVRLQDLGLVRTDESSELQPLKPRSSSEDPVAGWFADLRRVDLDLELRLDQVGGYQGLEANHVGFKIRLEDGELSLTDAGADYQGGRLTTRLHADARTPNPTIEFSLETKALNLARVMSQFDEDTDYSGIVDATCDLKAEGDTLSALRGSLAGEFNASMRDGNAASKVAREFIVNLTETVFPKLHVKTIPNVGCAVVDLVIEHGIAHVLALQLEGKEVGITGSGQIDLRKGLYDLHIIPKTSNPGILSLAPEVQVTGPLDDPKFHPLKRTLITSFGKGLLQNAVKPVGVLLRPFLPKGASESSTIEPCRPSTARSDQF